MKTKKLTMVGLFMSLVLVLFSADPPQYGTPFNGVPDPRDAVIYQVNIRCFSANRNIQGVIARLDNIKALGVNVIYLMPIYPVGTLKAFNSPYCIKDFKSVGSEYGTLTDLRNLVDAAHARGMAVILDWVANQTSWDHPWITQYPDWYQRDANGNIIHLETWTDVAALNHNNASMRAAMIEAMRYWIFAANIDGYRFDYANNPNILPYWSSYISNLRSIPNRKLLLLAEGDNTQHYTYGFDYIFGDQFYYNTLKPIYLNGSTATLINTSNSVEYVNASSTQMVARYLSNHDVYSAEGSPFNILRGKAGVLAAFVVSAYMKSVPFIYNGMEVGNTVALPFPFNTSVINWTQDLTVTSEMTKILSFRNANTTIRRGTLTSYTNNDVCAFLKVNGTERVFVLVNLRNTTRTFSLPSGIANTTMYDAYTGASVNLSTSISLAAYQYRVFKNTPNATVPVTSVSVLPTSASLTVGQTIQLTATISPSNATNQNVTWTSNNTGVASVNSSGLVTALAAGSATITVTTQDGGKTATSAITVTNPTLTYYRIQNRWLGTYMYDNGTQLAYGNISNTDYRSHWLVETNTEGFKLIKNRSTGEYINIESIQNYAECTAVPNTFWSAQWIIEDYSGYKRFRNRWQSANYLHTENRLGYVQQGLITADAWSSHWSLITVSTKMPLKADIKTKNIIEMYPNPVYNGKLYLQNINKIYKLNFYDVNGKLLLTKTISDDQVLDVSMLKKGVYFVNIIDEKQNSFQKLIVK